MSPLKGKKIFCTHFLKSGVIANLTEWITYFLKGIKKFKRKTNIKRKRKPEPHFLCYYNGKPSHTENSRPDGFQRHIISNI